MSLLSGSEVLLAQWMLKERSVVRYPRVGNATFSFANFMPSVVLGVGSVSVDLVDNVSLGASSR